MPSRTRIAIALFAIYVVWGSTYLAIAIGVRTLPPLAMAAARFSIAGAGLYAVLRATGTPRPSREEWKTAAIVGLFLLLGGNGVVTLNAHALPSGIVALVIGTTPLFVVLLPWLGGGPRPSSRTLVALALGLAGVATLAVPNTRGVLPLANVLALVLACLSWATGSLISKRLPPASSMMMATAQQMCVGGLALALLALARGEASAVHVDAISRESLLAFAYLTVFGSITGYGAYVYLLRVTRPAVATSYAYVNPLLALLLGHGLAREPLDARVLVAAAFIVGSVVLLTWTPSQVSRASGSPPLPRDPRTSARTSSAASPTIERSRRTSDPPS